MGQYYHGCVLKENGTTIVAWVYSHDIKHRYKGYDGKFHECGNGLKLMEHSYLKNDFVRAFETLIFENPQRVVWGGDYAKNCKGLKTNLYERCNDKNKVIPENRIGLKQGRYILNISKKMFVDKYKVPSFNDGYQIHPIPLLTSEGNGSGGGDFWGNDKNKIVGSWARDFISVQGKKPKGFTELIFDLIEE
jgi:hypothetical protein